MPRPTAAQFLYGALTVVFATLAMLLLFQTSSGAGLVVIAVAALALGLLVAATTASRTSASAHRAAVRTHIPDSRQPHHDRSDTLCTAVTSRRY
jgi:hypothetical protein